MSVMTRIIARSFKESRGAREDRALRQIHVTRWRTVRFHNREARRIELDYVALRPTAVI